MEYVLFETLLRRLSQQTVGLLSNFVWEFLIFNQKKKKKSFCFEKKKNSKLVTEIKMHLFLTPFRSIEEKIWDVTCKLKGSGTA